MASLPHCKKELTYLLLLVLFPGGCESVVKEESKTEPKKTSINYDKLSVEELQPLTKGGDTEAQGVLAPMYMLGEGVPQDHKEGVKWFQLSVAQGHKDVTKFKNLLAKQMSLSQIQKAQRLATEFKPKKEKPKK